MTEDLECRYLSYARSWFQYMAVFFLVTFSVIGAAGDAAVGGVSSLVTLGVFKYFAGGMFRYSYLNHLLIY